MERTIRIELAAGPLPLRFVSRHATLWRIAKWMSEQLAPYIPQTGEPISVYEFSARCVFLSFVLLLPLFPVGLFLGLEVHPLLFLLAPVPFLFLILPTLALKSKIGDRGRAQEEELPFFAVYAAVLQAAGISLYRALQRIVGSGLFRQLESDAKRLRWVERVGQLEALEELGRTTPNEKLRNFILGYTSEVRSGGDVSRYLETKCSDFLKDEEERWKRYTSSVGTIGEVFLSLLIIFPTLSLSAAFLAPESTGPLTLLVPLVVVPAITVAGFGILRSAQPKSYDEIEFSKRALAPSLFVFFLSFFILLLLWANPFLLMVLPLSLALLAYGILVQIQQRVISAEEEGAIEFLRDLTEYQKMGHDLPTAVKRLAREREYNRHFDKILRYVASQLELNVPLSDLEVPSRSWAVRMAFFQFSCTAEVGGYTSRSLELLTTYLSEMRRQKVLAAKSLSLYRLLALLTPLILFSCFKTMSSLFLNISYAPMPGSEPVPFLSFQLPPYFLAVGTVTIVICTLCSGILVSYASCLTPKATLWPGLGLLLAAGAVALM